MWFPSAFLILLPLLTRLQATLAIPLDASLNQSQSNLGMDHKLKCYNPGTFDPHRGLIPVDYHRCLPLLNDMLAVPGAQFRDKHASTEGDLPVFQNDGCLIDLTWAPNTQVVEAFSIMEMAVAAAVTIKGCIEIGGHVRRGGVGWITRYELFRVEVRSPLPSRASNLRISNASSSLDPSASGIIGSSAGSALERRSSLDTEATSSFMPSVNTDSVNTTDPASAFSFHCHTSPLPGTDVGEIPPGDCYYLFYEQLNLHNVLARRAMYGLNPRPEVYFGKCHLNVKGTSTHSTDRFGTADVITMAARIVNKCYEDTYEYALYGGISSVGRSNEFTCEIFTPISYPTGG